MLLKQIEFKDKIIKLETDLLRETNEQFRRELHDHFGSLLSIVRMQLTAHQRIIPESQHKLISSSILMVDELIKDVKSKSNFLLQHQFYEDNFNKAVEQLVHFINDTNSISIHFKTAGIDLKFQEKNGLQVYRMIQEILHNAIQHSNANIIILEMVGLEEQYMVKYYDNGCGFDMNDELFKPGFGLKTLKERAELIGGNLTIESRKNFDTIIEFVLLY